MLCFALRSIGPHARATHTCFANTQGLMVCFSNCTRLLSIRSAGRSAAGRRSEARAAGRPAQVAGGRQQESARRACPASRSARCCMR
ncbi:unnamed protein product [Mycena citricolor]|uniref:Uncharacterized protein n=1 Tax=Mycena citricolor TaxID=2018698 RepID=A0AAD2HDZ4_9AGAR|nr:unnamed protein product [Mycena citricolor]CAK5273035.1 unnamed protein product [Mycena citricolor]CAK5273084.1 unnamed protein product [Mycena citricolor]CAK5273085.1 unnamed protein product [Mycena citricolor]CAK5273126.1 unnamed protein product [Mycena citricolor]